MTKRRLWAPRLGLFALLVVLSVGRVAPGEAQESETAVDPYDGVLPELEVAVVERAGPLDTYRIDVEFDPDAARIEGRVDLTFVNRRPEPLAELFLRLYPNDPYFLDAGMTVERVRVGKENLADPAALLSVEATVLRVPLTEPLAPLDDVRLRIDFTTSLMTGPFDLGSFLGQDAWTETWLLEDWHPVVAPYLEESGWYVEPLSAETGPAVFENALFDVRLKAPDKLVVVATGAEIEREERDRVIERRWVTGPVRNFVVVADNDYTEFTAEVGGTLLTAYADWQDAAMVNYARQALDYAAAALVAYSERFGPYPYTELDLIVMPYLGGNNFAVSGMVFVSVYYEAIDDGDGYPTYKPDERFFEFAVVHEVGHQWWWGSVNSDLRRHTYLVEGLTQYLTVEFIRWTDGDDAAREAWEEIVVPSYLEVLDVMGDQIADRTGLGDLGEAHHGMVYGKGALAYLAIHRQIGDDAFYGALETYAEDFAFGISGPEDLLRGFETASGQELDELWRHWFFAAETTPDEVEALLRVA